MTGDTFKGQVVLITGAGRGIGEAVAHAFAERGANLVLTARTEPEVAGVAQQIANRGGKAIALHGDVSKRADVEGVVSTTLHQFGRLDVLVNAAGVYGPIGSFVDNDLDQWIAAVETNLFGTIFASHAVLPRMMSSKKGVIINFSGGGAVQPLPKFSAYGASKAAVVRFTETLAAEVKDTGIRVNAIAPGAVNTRLLDEAIAAGANAGPEFHAKALTQKINGGTPPTCAADLAVFLASAAGSGISGRLISAVWDDWKSLSNGAEKLQDSALFTLRRIDGRQFLEFDPQSRSELRSHGGTNNQHNEEVKA